MEEKCCLFGLILIGRVLIAAFHSQNMFHWCSNRTWSAANFRPTSKHVDCQWWWELLCEGNAMKWTYNLLNYFCAHWQTCITYLARLIATFNRFLLLMKPRPYLPSCEMCLGCALTVEMIMTFFSWPWNSSTLPILGSLPSWHASHCKRMSFTCNAYGVMIPMSSSVRPDLYSSPKIHETCLFDLYFIIGADLNES